MKTPYITILFVLFLAISWYEKSYSESKVNVENKEERLRDEYFKYFEANNAKSFFPVAEKLKNIYIQKGHKEKFYRIWCNEVIFYVNVKNLHRAISEVGKMRIDALNSNNKYGEALSCYDLGIIYEISKDNKLAKKYYNESIKLMTQFHSNEKIAPLYNRLATLYIETEPKKADSLLDLAMKKETDWTAKYDCYSQECYLGLTTDNAEKFYKYYKRCKYIEWNRNKFIVPEWRAYLEVIKQYFDKNYNRALYLTKNITEDADKHHIRYYIYKKIGDSDKALIEMEKMYQYEESSRAVADNEDFIAITQEMDKAKMQKERQEMQNKIRNITYSGFTFFLLLMIVLLHYLFIRKKNELKKLNRKNEELKLAREQAEASEKMKIEFIENMSHEIRTPLNTISGFTQIMATDTIDIDHETRKSMSFKITDNVKKLTDIIDNILELSALKSNGKIAGKEQIECNAFCKETLLNMTDSKSRRVKLIFTSNLSENKKLIANKHDLLTSIGKILTNACKFTTEGYIHMHCESSIDEKNLILSISDTGPGIPTEKAEVIFDKFVKLNSFTPGTGLGLTTCRYIIDKMGGMVILDKNYKNGCKFVITLPFGDIQ